MSQIERQSNQGTTDWLMARLGCATASCFADIVTVSKRDGKPLKARDDYLKKLIAERITGVPKESPTSYSMQWGTDAEPYARSEYEINTGNFVKEIGFVLHQDNEWIGASSDGLVGDKGSIEIKCPNNSEVHIATWLEGMPEHHIPQIQGQMWVLNLEWVDFCSYDPRMPEDFRLYIQRIQRDNKYIENLSKNVEIFLDEVDQKVKQFLNIKKSV